MKPVPVLSMFAFLAVVCAAGLASAATVSDEVRRLRTEANDLDAAAALAQEYLQANPELTSERQSVQFELGRTYYAAKQYDAALTTLRGLVADYSMTTLDKASDAFMVDDAQFYVGVIEHYFGDRAKGIEGYTKAIDDVPKSNRRAQALMLLAGVYEQDGEKAKALERFKQLVAEHPKSEQAPEAQLHVGHLLRADGKLDDAIAAFQRVAKDWPESKHAPMSLLNANRALMEQEIKSAEDANLSKEHVFSNEKPVQGNLKTLLEKYGDSEEIPQVMQDLINYYSNPAHLMYDPQARDKIRAAAAWLRQNKPETRQALRAVCEYAICGCSVADDPQEALAEMDDVMEMARASGDASLLFDVQFNKAHVLKLIGEVDKAREIWTQLLEVAPDDHTADEIRIMLIMLDPIEERLKEYQAIADDETRHRDTRSTALVFLAVDHFSEDRFEEALVAVNRVIADFSDTGAVAAAKDLRDRLERLVKVPIENRGDYVRR